MAEYYLISQLPSLDGLGEDAPLPITEERFWELCGRLLKPKARAALDALTLLPPQKAEEAETGFVGLWNENERALRLALAKVRAEKMKKPFDIGGRVLPVAHIRAAEEATAMDNPLEAERYLNRYRLAMLEAQRPTDSFSEDYVLYYGLKLKLLQRNRQFDAAVGEKAYKNIYHSVLSENGEVVS